MRTGSGAAGGLVYIPQTAGTTASGIGAEVQSAAAWNAQRFARRTLSDVLMGAKSKLVADKVVTGEDAEAVIGAEM
ncbi:hypothetical protein Scep_009580 [Stephania cephalantha]|uniref:SMP domain-containing protein n=1 Tax=Stephania cephalantha TaxID=152367 RepID=A0AAP0PEG7_9MAGN